MSSGPCSGVLLFSRHAHGISSGVPVSCICLLFSFFIDLAFPCDYGRMGFHQYAGLGSLASLHWLLSSLLAHRMLHTLCFARLWIASLFLIGLVITAGVRPRGFPVSGSFSLADICGTDTRCFLDILAFQFIAAGFPAGDGQSDEFALSTH